MGDPGGSTPLCSMSHEPKSPSLGMISTATRTTATVSPLTPSPLNGSIVANGSPAAQSAHSGFAAALRKLAKQAEEPRDTYTTRECHDCVHTKCSVLPGERMNRGRMKTVSIVTCVHVCGRRLPFLLGAQSMLGHRGSVSLTSPSGACLGPRLMQITGFVLRCQCMAKTVGEGWLCSDILAEVAVGVAEECLLCLYMEKEEMGGEGAASSISSESSPVSSPATNHSSPVSTPKRGPLGQGPVLVPPPGHSVPNTPPVVTIAPTKTSNGLWRSEGRQADSVPRGASRERLGAEGNHPQEKGGPSVPAHLLGNPYAFGLSPGAVMQDSRFQPLNMARQMSNAVPPGHVPEEYLRGFRPYATTEDALRMPSLPMGLDPATAAAAAAYYHPSYLPHPSFTPY
ncbi:Genetic suppressor element 1, partial [Dissostichus eleginoides]